MATLSLKPNSRKTPPLAKPAAVPSEWEFKDAGVMQHSTGFIIQFFNAEECEINHIPKDMSFSMIRELTSKAIRARNKQFR